MKFKFILSIQVILLAIIPIELKAQLIRFKDIQLTSDTNKRDFLGKQGIWIERYLEAESIVVNNYKNNVLNGKSYHFFNNGNLYAESNYYNGKNVDFDKAYTVTGKLILFNKYFGDTIIVCRYDTTERLIGRYRLINGQVDTHYDSAYVTPEFIENFQNPKNEITSSTEYTQIPGLYFLNTYVGGKLVSSLSMIADKPSAMYEYEDEILTKSTVYKKEFPYVISKKIYYDKHQFKYKIEYYDSNKLVYKTKKYKKLFGLFRVRCFRC